MNLVVVAQSMQKRERRERTAKIAPDMLRIRQFCIKIWLQEKITFIFNAF